MSQQTYSLEAYLNSEIHALEKNTTTSYGMLPYENLILYAISNGVIEKAKKNSHKIDQAYLRWQLVRLYGIPLSSSQEKVTFKTGFEGYFVGKVKSQAELFESLLQIGQSSWLGIKRLHKFNTKRICELKNTILSNEVASISTISEWSTILGSQIARLRMNLIHNPEALDFQTQTKRAVTSLPLLEYTLEPVGLKLYKYELPKPTQKTKKLEFENLNEEQILYWNIVLNLGKFGHPLIRAALQELR
jgi:hypothetical protein